MSITLLHHNDALKHVPLIKSVPDRSMVNLYWKSRGFPSALLHTVWGGGIPDASQGRVAFLRMSIPTLFGAFVITGAAEIMVYMA